MPKISVVIPTLNEEYYIADLLSDLQRQTHLPYEIIVVDGFSKDKTKQIVKRFLGVTFMQMQPHVAMQRDRGGQLAAGDLIYFLDADVRLRPDFLKRTSTHFVKRKLHLACPVYLGHNTSLTIQGIYLFYSLLFMLGQWIVPSGAGSGIIVKRNVYQKNHGFSKEYKFDDIELIRRLSREYRFGMLMTPLYVSDRRFRKEGTLKMFFTYLKLSFYFVTNNFSGSNNVKYIFGKFGKANK